MNLRIIKTNDGSSSLYNEDLDETYHSIHGSVNEAKHVFIQKGLKEITSRISPVNILEIGFGTGLNTYLTAEFFKNNPQFHGNYTGLDNTPLMNEVLLKLDYAQTDSNLYEKLHSIPWEEEFSILDNFSVLKKQMDFLTCELKKDHFHLVYFDAFGPRAQEIMWRIENFAKLYKAMKKGGILVTYCAKGQVRRDMEAVGFNMERLEGPPGKREMLRATK